MAERALITGAAGYVGSHMATLLSGHGLEVHGTDLPDVSPPPNWPGPWHEGHINDASRIDRIVRAVEPDFIFHFAALTRSDSLQELLAVNVLGTQRLLDAVAALSPATRILVAGSAAEYGTVQSQGLPLREDAPLRPLSPYGLSKVAQSLLSAQYASRGSLHLIRTRTFNLTGPGEPDTMVCAAFARQIAEIENGVRAARLTTGNLESARDFLDIRDAVSAYWLAITHGQAGEVYNVCSGMAVTIKSLLSQLLDLTQSDIEVQTDAGKFTTWDVPVHYGDNSKLRAVTQWTPAIPLAESLADLLHDWRERISG